MAGPDRANPSQPRLQPPSQPLPQLLPSDLRWQCLPFPQLPAPALYRLLALRSRVFVVEQRCLYQDMDGADLGALQVFATAGGHEQVVATARVLAPGVRYEEPSIGRVCTEPACRGRGWGRLLMEFALRCTGEHHPGRPIRISAQAHLQPFYESLGFVAASGRYLEDGIAHVEMLRDPR